MPAGGPYFKFIGGANLRDTRKVELLATLYALAGASLLDFAAEAPVVEAAARGIARARQWHTEQPAWLLAAFNGLLPPWVEPMIMVSITLTGDRHTQIAVVDLDTCTRCDVCTPICPPGSIINGDVEDPICTGCGLCVDVCPPLSIVLAPRETDPDAEACWAAGARALEIHTGEARAHEVAEIQPLARHWQTRGGLLSYSIDGRTLGYPRALALARELGRPGIIIQADGKPISGTVGDRSTLPALRFARALLRAGNPAWIQPAGGTNDRSGRLASRHGIPIAGVGIGSFARRCARALEEGDERPTTWTEALRAARSLVESVVTPQSTVSPTALPQGGTSPC